MFFTMLITILHIKDYQQIQLNCIKCCFNANKKNVSGFLLSQFEKKTQNAALSTRNQLQFFFTAVLFTVYCLLIFVLFVGNKLHKALKDDQWNILCPQNQLSNPEDWDITLLIAVLRTVIGLKPLGGWDIKNLNPNDQSIGAYLYLVRKLRNDLKHGAVGDIPDLATFKTFWSRMENILLGLKYKDMQKFYNLEQCSLDKHNSLIHAMLGNLMKDVNDLSNEASDNAKEIKTLQQKIQAITACMNQLATTKADKVDVQGNSIITHTV